MRSQQILGIKTFTILMALATFWHSPDAFAQTPDQKLCGFGKTSEHFAACVRLAEAGDVFAMTHVGRGYLFGEGVQKDEKLSVPWFRKAAFGGDKMGMFLYASAFTHGTGVEVNLDEGRRWMEKAANAGSMHAQVEFAEFLVLRSSTPDVRAARSYLEKSWASGYSAAGYRLAAVEIADGQLTRNPQAVRTMLEQSWQLEKQSCGNCPYLDSAVKILAIARELGVGGPVDIEGAKEIYGRIERVGMGGTNSKYSNGRGDSESEKKRNFRLPSRLTDISIEKQNEMGVTQLRDVTPGNYVSGARRPVLDFDLQIFINQSQGWSVDTVTGHVEAAAKLMATCDIRLRQARLWTVRDEDLVKKKFWDAYPAISVFFTTPPRERYVHGFAVSYTKSVDIYNTTEAKVLDSRGNGAERAILAHEVGHIFGLPHPATLEPSIMQYGWLARLGPAFTPQQCEQMRQHELLTNPFIVQQQVPAVPARTASTSPSSAASQRFDAAFRDVQNLLLEKNQRAFSHYTALAISMKHGIAWSDAVNIINLATTWTADRGTFDAAKHFKPGAPANVQALDPAISRDSALENLDLEIPKFRQDIVAARNFKILERFDLANTIKAQPGQRLELDNASKEKAYSLVKTATSYIVGGDLITVDSSSDIVLAVHPNFLNFYERGDDAKMWALRKLPIDPASTQEQHRLKAANAEPTSELRGRYGKDVPATLDGGKAVSAEEVVELYKAAAKGKIPAPWVFASDMNRIALPNAYQLPSGSRVGTLDDENQKNLETLMNSKGISKNHPIVTYCLDERCYESHILARRLIALGYTNVYWMRAGLRSWLGLGLPVTKAEYLK